MVVKIPILRHVIDLGYHSINLSFWGNNDKSLRAVISTVHTVAPATFLSNEDRQHSLRTNPSSHVVRREFNSPFPSSPTFHLIFNCIVDLVRVVV